MVVLLVLVRNRNPLLVPALICPDVTKEPGATVVARRSLFFGCTGWAKKKRMHWAKKKRMQSKPPSGPGVNLSRVTKELGATIDARLSVHKKRAKATFEDEEQDEEYNNHYKATNQAGWR